MYKLTCLHHPKSGEGDLISIDTGDKVSSDIGDKVSSEPGDKKKLHVDNYLIKRVSPKIFGKYFTMEVYMQNMWGKGYVVMMKTFFNSGFIDYLIDTEKNES